MVTEEDKLGCDATLGNPHWQGMMDMTTYTFLGRILA